ALGSARHAPPGYRIRLHPDRCSAGPAAIGNSFRLSTVVVQAHDLVVDIDHGAGRIVARALDLSQVELVDVTGHVVAVKYRAVEPGDGRITFAHRIDQILQILIDQPVGADQLRHLIHGPVVCNQFVGRGHVDAVDVGVTYLWRCRAKVDILRSGFTGHLNDLTAGGTADDGVIHKQHVLATELQLDGVELLAYGLLACRLAGHDEGTADIAVLDKPLTELDAQPVGQLHCGGTAGVRDRDDHVDAMVRPLAQNLFRQFLAHAQTGLVHQDAINDGVGAGQIDMLEDAGSVLRVVG